MIALHCMYIFSIYRMTKLPFMIKLYIFFKNYYKLLILMFSNSIPNSIFKKIYTLLDFKFEIIFITVSEKKKLLSYHGF
jgi:hypothetical protein